MQDFEVVVVEGGSTDSTTQQKARAIEHPWVRKLFQDQSTRVGHNRLRGLSAARGKYIVLLDADDKLEPTLLLSCPEATVTHHHSSFMTGEERKREHAYFATRADDARLVRSMRRFHERWGPLIWDENAFRRLGWSVAEDEDLLRHLEAAPPAPAPS